MLLPLLVFVSVTLAVGGLLLWLVPTRAEQRLQAVTGNAAPRGEWTETVVKIAGPLANLSAPQGDWETSPLRLRFLHAGIRHPEARLYYFAAKTVLPLALAAAAFFAVRAMGNPSQMVLMAYVVNSALIGCYLPNFVLHLLVRSRQREIFENFPDAADLMLVCVEAGLGLDAGLTRVADEIRRKSEALAEELHLTNLEMRAGGTREQALRNLALRTGVEETHTFATMLTQADRFGTSIGESLRVFSDDLRHKRQMRAEERAAKVPTKMLFPLVLCIFPSIIMVILGPAIIQMVRTLQPMLQGVR
jgi:tight adherence protein C